MMTQFCTSNAIKISEIATWWRADIAFTAKNALCCLWKMMKNALFVGFQSLMCLRDSKWVKTICEFCAWKINQIKSSCRADTLASVQNVWIAGLKKITFVHAVEMLDHTTIKLKQVFNFQFFWKKKKNCIEFLRLIFNVE